MLSKLIQDWKNLTLFPNTQMPYLCCAFKSSIYVNWIWFRFLACMKFECVWNMTNHICAGIQMKHGLTMPHVWEEGSFVKQISERVRCLLATPLIRALLSLLSPDITFLAMFLFQDKFCPKFTYFWV